MFYGWVNEVTGCDRSSILGRGENIYLLHYIQVDPVAHPGPYAVLTTGFFQVVKATAT
jgi:hypothetical protein